MDALLKNGFSDIRCSYHSNIIYQMYMKYCSVCIYMVNDQYKVSLSAYKFVRTYTMQVRILMCRSFSFLLSVHGSLKKKTKL